MNLSAPWEMLGETREQWQERCRLAQIAYIEKMKNVPCINHWGPARRPAWSGAPPSLLLPLRWSRRSPR